MKKECRFCGGPIRRWRYETNATYDARDYCGQPLCLTRGKQEHLEPLYAKGHPQAVSRHREAFLTRALFVSRWGMEPLDAFDAYGKEAVHDWEELYLQVKAGRAVAIRVTVEVYDARDNEPVLALEDWKHALYPEDGLADMATSVAFAAEQTLSEELTRSVKRTHGAG